MRDKLLKCLIYAGPLICVKVSAMGGMANGAALGEAIGFLSYFKGLDDPRQPGKVKASPDTPSEGVAGLRQAVS